VLSPQDFRRLRDSLADPEKQKLDDIFKKQLNVQRDIIDQNILRDREHLRLVNFCIRPFQYNETLYVETGYLFIRVEPFFGSATKNFDVLIFNQSSKVMLLVECKSSVSDAEREVRELVQCSEAADSRSRHLEELVGDAINIKETVICTNAAYASRIKSCITANDLPICLWSADQTSGILLLEKQGQDVNAEISRGRLHHDGKLTRLLLDGVRSEGIRSLTFLPSSHPCTILEETITLLGLSLESSNRDRFRLPDLTSLLNRESSLSNFGDQELWNLAQHLLNVGVEVQIFTDLTPTVDDLGRKEFSISTRPGGLARMAREVRKKYTDFHARRIAEENSVTEFQKIVSRMYKKLEEYSQKVRS